MPEPCLRPKRPPARKLPVKAAAGTRRRVAALALTDWLRFGFRSTSSQFPRQTGSPLSGRAWTSLPGRCFGFGSGRARLKIGKYPKPESELLCPPVTMRREGAPGDGGCGCLSPMGFRCLCSFRHGPFLQGGVAVEGVQQIGIVRHRMVRCRRSVQCRQSPGG